MKIEINAVPISTLDDIQNVLKRFINPCDALGFFTHKGTLKWKKGFVKGVQMAIDVIEMYKKGDEKWQIR